MYDILYRVLHSVRHSAECRIWLAILNQTRRICHALSTTYACNTSSVANIAFCLVVLADLSDEDKNSLDIGLGLDESFENSNTLLFIAVNISTFDTQ